MMESDPHIRAVAVFCGSKAGIDPAHRAAAEALGRGLAERGIRLVYGGGSIGLMGVVSGACTAAGGDVVGVMPEFLLAFEVGNTEGRLEITDSMHARKQRMFELADAFVSLAGGIGTLDETVEMISWKQLRLHDKPIVVLSENGAWDGLAAMIDGFVDAGFAGPSCAGLFHTVNNVPAVFEALEAAAPARIAVPAERL